MILHHTISVPTRLTKAIPMNNSAFKDLLSSNSKTSSSSSPAQHGAFKQPAAALGSRMRSSIPMTPRNVPGQKNNNRSDFARQVAEVTTSSLAAHSGEGPPLKKFKSNAAPRGTKLASGYVDRAGLLRDGNDDEESGADKEKRLKALEELYKLQQIDLETFERQKEQIGVGGDVSSTHLVRGLDWKLLARVKRGEDINKAAEENEPKAKQPQNVNIDDEFDKVLEQEVVAKATSPDMSADGSDPIGETSIEKSQQRLSRDEILRRFKQNRGQQVPSTSHNELPPAPVLNDRFKKIPVKETAPKKEKFIESIEGRRREVLLITNPDGTTKRKTRWLDPIRALNEESQDATVKDEKQKHSDADLKGIQSKKQLRTVMGMEVPAEVASREAARKAAELAAAEDDDDDIFQGVGDSYDPLADISGDDSAESNDEAEKDVQSEPKDITVSDDTVAEVLPKKKRNYFAKTSTEHGQAASEDEDEDKTNPMIKDPTILAALKRAADIRRREEDNPTREPADNEPGGTDRSKAFLAKLREHERQDAADLDMGFGGSRFDEDDEDDGQHGDLLDFADGDNDEDGGNKGKASGKRGPRPKTTAEKKKNKKKTMRGDKNNFADVMGVIESRKK